MYFILVLIYSFGISNYDMDELIDNNVNNTLVHIQYYHETLDYYIVFYL